jgi:4-hydroxybenzoate polyprenyltransferase
VNNLKIITSTSIFISINALFVVMLSFRLYEVDANLVIYVIAFLITLSIYNLNKVTDKNEDLINKPNLNLIKTSYLKIIAIVSMILSIILSASFGIKSFLIVTLPLILGIFYNCKFFPSKPRLKEIVGVKSLVVAFSWAFTGSLLPSIIESIVVKKIIFNFTYIFILIFINTVLFDILDIEGDKECGITTIPISFGLKKTYYLLNIINCLLIPFLIYCLIEKQFINYKYALIWGFFYNILIIFIFSKNIKRGLLAELMIDGEWIPLIIITNFIK